MNGGVKQAPPRLRESGICIEPAEAVQGICRPSAHAGVPVADPIEHRELHCVVNQRSRERIKSSSVPPPPFARATGISNATASKKSRPRLARSQLLEAIG